MQVNSISPRRQQTSFGALKFDSELVKTSLLSRLSKEEKVELNTLIEGQKTLKHTDIDVFNYPAGTDKLFARVSNDRLTLGFDPIERREGWFSYTFNKSPIEFIKSLCQDAIHMENNVVERLKFLEAHKYMR